MPIECVTASARTVALSLSVAVSSNLGGSYAFGQVVENKPTISTYKKYTPNTTNTTLKMMLFFKLVSCSFIYFIYLVRKASIIISLYLIILDFCSMGESIDINIQSILYCTKKISLKFK